MQRIRAASRAEGMPRTKIINNYCMKNILPPMITIMAIAVPHLPGTYAVEMVFGHSGLDGSASKAPHIRIAKHADGDKHSQESVVVDLKHLAQIIGGKSTPRMRYEEGSYEEAKTKDCHSYGNQCSP